MDRNIGTAANISKIRFAEQGSNPAAPDAGYWTLFVKADGVYARNSAGTVQGPFLDEAAPVTHNLLSVTHADTVAAAVTRGALIVGNATPKWDALAVGAANTVLGSDGTDAAWWSQSFIDHNELSNLTTGDVHEQYALLGGRAGGQTLNGDTAAGGNLSLVSTVHPTKGKIFIGASSAWDDAQNRLGVGTQSPLATLHVSPPTTSVAGNVGVFLANGNLSVPATGTVSVSAGTASVTGVGTAFLTELQAGCAIKIGAESHIVRTITSNTAATIVSNHVAGASGVTAYKDQDDLIRVKTGSGVTKFLLDKGGNFGLNVEVGNPSGAFSGGAFSYESPITASGANFEMIGNNLTSNGVIGRFSVTHHYGSTYTTAGFIEFLRDGADDQVAMRVRLKPTGVTAVEVVRFTALKQMGLGTATPTGILHVVPTWTVASGASAVLNDVLIAAATVTVTGSTNVTTATGFNYFVVQQPTFSGTVTITHGATLYIANAPATSGGLSITVPAAIRVGGGMALLADYAAVATANRGTVSLGGGAWDGSTSGFFAGSSSGTYFAINTTASFAGSHTDFQQAGKSVFKVSAVASAVNGFLFTVSATGNAVAFAAQGTDTNIPLNIDTKGSGALVFQATGTGGITLSRDVTISDAKNIILNATTGTKFGTATNQKLGFWNVAPIVQPTTAIAVSTFVANTSGIVNDTATWDGYTVGQVVKALRNVGLLA